MINQHVKTILMKNWGDEADSLNCYAEVKFIDPLSDWQCYIYALNPDDEDRIECLLYTRTMGVQLANWSLKELCLLHNEEGESPIIDAEYRRTRASELFKKLNEAV